MEAARDRIMRGHGTDDPWYTEEMTRQIGMHAIAIHWRKPLRIDEVNRLPATAEVRQRPGRA
jgi:hypothetical protein